MEKVILLVKTSPSNTMKEDAMENFLQTIHKILPNNAPISLEIASSNQFLKFYIVTNAPYKGLIESQLYAQYPEVEIEIVDDYLSQNFDNASLVQIDFKHQSIYPFLTYQHMEENFLKLLSAILSKTDPDEEVFFQITLKRVGSDLFDRGLSGTRMKLFGSKNAENPAYAKFSQELYMGKLRIGYVAKNRIIANQKLDIITHLLAGVNGPHNELHKRSFFVPKNLSTLFKTRTLSQSDLWSPAEVATLYHFPYDGGIVSNVVQTSSKRAPAPDILPVYGHVNPNEVSFVGQTNYRNDNKIFGIKRIDRRRHLYVVGKTGSGKSKLLELLLIADIQGGQGCCLIDPHGDLATEIMKYVPENRIDDVIFVDPTDKDFPVGFNPLEPVIDYEVRQQLSTFFIAIFKKLFESNWNARMEHLIRYITLALLETPDSNVLGIARMLSDTAYRQNVIKQIQDPVVKAFWTNEFTPSDSQFANEAIIPILNKVGQFISNPVVRNIVGQRKNVLDFEKFMNEGKIVIISLSKGKLGDENTALLGSMFITKIQQAALARAKIPEEERRDFYFYVDEFQNFATDAFSSILSEARKYHLDLTIAHQYIAQLPEDVRATAFGNVATIIAFAIGGDDAAYLSKEFSPVFTADDMISLSSREMYIKMSIGGKLTPPFSARTLNVPQPTSDYTQQIIERSRGKYAKTKAVVETEIAQWTQSGNIATNTSTNESIEEAFPEPIL